jgi:putative peptidoglycan lipid II flippase
MAFLVSPMSNSLLPEIARLRSQLRVREAFHLIDKTLGLAALAAVAGCAIGIGFRVPAIVLLFQRGNFTPESTRLVAAVFLGLCPSLVGWSLLELTSRSLFALDQRGLPLLAAAIPVLFNVALTFWLKPTRPELIGIGASAGLLLGFLFLFVSARAKRKSLMAANERE